MRALSLYAVGTVLLLAAPVGFAALPMFEPVASVAPDHVSHEVVSPAPSEADDGPVCVTVAPLPPCNIWASRTPTGPANEVHVAVNPNDPLHVMVVGKDYSLGNNGDCASGGAYHVGSAYYVTFDGGETWNVGRIPAPYPNGGAEPSPLPNKCGSDPVAIIGEDGTAYYIVLNFQYTGGRKAVIAVAKSDDGGLTWPEDQIRILHSSAGNDKEWGVVDSEGRVHVVWTDLSTGRILHSRSDASWTFSTPTTLGFIGGGNPAVTVDTGPDDEVYVVWRASSRIMFTKSEDHGATFSPATVAFTVQPYENSIPPRLPFMPQLAVDQDENSPFTGTIYVTWPDRRQGGSSVFIASSSDEGASWTTPVRIDDSPVASSRAVMPTVDVAPGGRVDVGWLDERFAETTSTLGGYHAFAASSTNRGMSWSEDQLVSEFNLVSQWSRHQNGAAFIGDYIGIASTPDYAWLTFPGNGPGRVVEGMDPTDYRRTDAYVAAVVPPLLLPTHNAATMSMPTVPATPADAVELLLGPSAWARLHLD